MCLILLSWRAQAAQPFVVAANRDEFHARPTAPARFWEDRAAILAGRDLRAMGTWMGVSRGGRFAAVTNYRGGTEPSAAHSRGELVAKFLESDVSAGAYVGGISGAAYSGFNLLACDGEDLWWMSNRDGAPRRLAPGVYGLGNLLLDSPEVEPDKARFCAAVEPAAAVEALFAALGPARLVNERYGTRCSTVLLRDAQGRVEFAERSFDPQGGELDTRRYAFGVAAA